ncbi:MAG TPA: MMPL family transporter [Blastocatellia bacterium]
MDQLGMLVVSRPKLIIAVILAITIAFGAVLATKGINFNGSLQTLAKKDSSLDFFNNVKSIFGDDSVIIVALTAPDVFDRNFLSKLDALTTRLKTVRGVEEVQSLTTERGIAKTADGIAVDRLIPRNATDADLARLRSSLTADPLYAKNYVSPDGKTAAINVFLKPMPEAETRAAAERVEQAATVGAAGSDLIIAGVPIMDARGIHSMLRDMLLLSPLAAVLCLIVYFLAFRSFWGSVLPVAALGIGLVWVIGLMSLLNRPITLATLSLPTVLIAVGGSYMFHVINQYRLSAAEGAQAAISAARGAGCPDHHYTAADCREAWSSGLRFIIPAVFVSGLITTAGFGALASSTIPAARDMGLFEAIGVTIVLLLTLTFVPAVLAVLPPKALGHNHHKGCNYAEWLTAPLKNLTALILFRRKTVWIAFILLSVVIGAGFFKMRVNTDYLRIFPKSSATVRDAEKLHERLAGAATIELVVSGQRGAVYDPGFLNSVGDLERFALAQPGVDSAISVADIIKRVGGLLGPPGSPEQIPPDKSTIEGLYRDFLSEEPSLARLVDAKNGTASRAVVILRTNIYSSSELHGLTARISDWAESNLPKDIQTAATGSVVLLDNASDAVATSQLSSMIIALLSIYIMMVALFRSLVTGLLALIPNLLPIVGFFGFLGWTGIPLDITTSLVATAALGLAVDNAVHMIRRYRQSCGLGCDEGATMWHTMLRTGKPMVLANFMLIAAFLIFIGSSFVPVRLGGLLWAVTISACLASDLVFLPVLMKSGFFARSASGKHAIAVHHGLVEGRATVIQRPT